VELAIPRDIQFAPGEWGASSDGARLYVLSPLSGELAIVDLAQRRILQKVSLGLPAATPAAASTLADLWTNVHRLLIGTDVQAKVPFSERLEVSPDGRRLYGVAARPDRIGVRGDGVLAIDTLQWSVAAHWLGGTEPFMLQLSPDGRRLYALDAQAGQSAGALQMVDTSSGMQTATVDGLGNGQLFSVAGLFREQYGHLARPPEVSVVTDPAPLAGIAARASPATVLAGDPLGVEVRFVDPGTGRTLKPDQSDVLFAPPAGVFAVISQTADPNVGLTVELDQVEYGSYRGTVSAPSPTNWSRGSFSVQSVAEWPDGLQRRTLVQDAVLVQPAVTGSDGRRYILRVTTEPAHPVVDQPVQVETSAVVPNSVTLFGGPPPVVDATFYADRSGGAIVRRLDSVRHGEYVGSISLFSPGPWRVLVSLGPPVSDMFAVGTLAVGKP
jgi:hypothetical protein